MNRDMGDDMVKGVSNTGRDGPRVLGMPKDTNTTAATTETRGPL